MKLDPSLWQTRFPLPLHRPGYTLQYATPQDLTDLYLWHRNRKWMSLAFGLPESDPQLTTELRHHAERCKQPQCHTILVQKESQTIGFLHIIFRTQHQQRIATLGIVLAPEHTEKGLGTEVVNTICTTIEKSTDTDFITLDTVDFNPRAIRCFEKCHFQEYRRSLQPGYIKIYMVRKPPERNKRNDIRRI